MGFGHTLLLTSRQLEAVIEIPHLRYEGHTSCNFLAYEEHKHLSSSLYVE